MAGDYRALYAVWNMYGRDEDDEEEDASIPPEPPERSTGQKIVDQFAEMLAE